MLVRLLYASRSVDTSAEGWSKHVLEATGGKGVALVVDQVSAPTINEAMAATAILRAAS